MDNETKFEIMYVNYYILCTLRRGRGILCYRDPLTFAHSCAIHTNEYACTALKPVRVAPPRAKRALCPLVLQLFIIDSSAFSPPLCPQRVVHTLNAAHNNSINEWTMERTHATCNKKTMQIKSASASAALMIGGGGGDS